MKLSTRLKQLVELLVALILPLSATFFVAQSNYDAEPSAEGRLSQYQNGVTPLYPGDSNIYPTYPGDNVPMYPGDEKWDGRYSYGLYAKTSAMAVDGNALYVSMYDLFTAGAKPDLRLMRFDGTDFHSVGWDLNATPDAIAASGNDIYVGGYDLTQAGGISVVHVAHLNGANTDNMGGGLSGTNVLVNKLVMYGSSVCVGGEFTLAGGNPSNNVACWDGANWQLLGGGVNGPVRAMVVSGGNLYVGGTFTQTAGVPANNIAYWDGSAWNALGNGLVNNVSALGFWQGDLYAAGVASDADFRPLKRWNGVNWDPISAPIGLAFAINSLTAGPDGLYVGGNFKGAPISPYSYPMNYIGRWDGASWHNLGSGIDGSTSNYNDFYSLNAVQLLGSRLFVGGRFLNAGNNTTSGLAAWNILPEVENYQATGSPIGPGSYVYLIGKSFSSYEKVSMLVNDVDLKSSKIANLDGKIYIHVWFPEYTPDGEYIITLSGASGSASTKVVIQEGAPKFMTDYAGTMVIMPFTGSNYILRIPMIIR